MVYAPYVEDSDDRLAQLCQAQIFFTLLSSIALKYDAGTLSNAVNMDILLSTLTLIPFPLAFLLETPLLDYATSQKKRNKAFVELTSTRKKANLLFAGVLLPSSDRVHRLRLRWQSQSRMKPLRQSQSSVGHLIRAVQAYKINSLPLILKSRSESTQPAQPMWM